MKRSFPTKLAFFLSSISLLTLSASDKGVSPESCYYVDEDLDDDDDEECEGEDFYGKDCDVYETDNEEEDFCVIHGWEAWSEGPETEKAELVSTQVLESEDSQVWIVVVDLNGVLREDFEGSLTFKESSIESYEKWYKLETGFDLDPSVLKDFERKDFSKEAFDIYIGNSKSPDVLLVDNQGFSLDRLRKQILGDKLIISADVFSEERYARVERISSVKELGFYSEERSSEIRTFLKIEDF